MAEIKIGVGVGTGITPRGGVNANRAHESAELQLSFVSQELSTEF